MNLALVAYAVALLLMPLSAYSKDSISLHINLALALFAALIYQVDKHIRRMEER